MTVQVISAPPVILQFFDNQAMPNAGGSILTQVGGVDYATYEDIAGSTPLPNPIPLNSRGEVSNASGQSCQLFLAQGVTYTFTMFDRFGNQLNQANSVSGLTQASFNAFLAASNILNLIYPMTPAEIAVNATIVNQQYPSMCVDRYFTNTGTNDSAPAFGTAFQVSQANKGGTITYGDTAPYMTLAPINFTVAYGANCYPWTLRGTGVSILAKTPSIIANHGGNPWNHVIDMTNTLAGTFENVSIGTMTTGSTFPTTGIFQSRGVGGSSVGVCRFINVSIVGSFTNSCYYNYAAEDNKYFGCIFYNTWLGGTCRSRTITGYNISGLTSMFQTVFGNGALTEASCAGHAYFGCDLYNASNDPNSDVTYIDAVSDFQSYGEFSFASDVGAGLRSNVYVNLSNAPSSQFRWDGLKTDPGNNSLYTFAFSNNAATCVEWQFDNLFTACTSITLAALGSSGVQGMYQWRINGWSETAAHGIAWGGTATYCYFMTGEMAVTIGSTGLGNIFIGNKAQLTLTTGAMTVINTHASQPAGWGGVSGAAVVNNYNVSTSTSTQDKQAIASLIGYMLTLGVIAP